MGSLCCELNYVASFFPVFPSIVLKKMKKRPFPSSFFLLPQTGNDLED
jgi:hypothetical protein